MRSSARSGCGCGRTLADVGQEAGVSTQYLSEVERGREEPSSEVIGAVAGALRTAPGRPDHARLAPAVAGQRPGVSRRVTAGLPAVDHRVGDAVGHRVRARRGSGRGRCPRAAGRRSGRCAAPGSPPSAARSRTISLAWRARSGSVPWPPAGRLVEHTRRVRQHEPPARLPAGQQHGRRRAACPTHVVPTCGPDELHGVVDRQHRGDRAAGGVEVEVDRASGLSRLQVQQLGDHDVGDAVVDLGADEDDPVGEQPAVDVDRTLAVRGLLDDARDRVVLMRAPPLRRLRAAAGRAASPRRRR